MVLVSAGVIVGSASLFLAGLLVTSGRIAAKAEKISQTRLAAQQRTEAIELLAGLKQGSREVEDYAQRLNQLLPAETNLLSFSSYLKELARVNEVELTGFQFGSKVAPLPDAPGRAGFALAVSGDYKRLRIFIDQLENKSAKFLVGLTNLDTSRAGENYNMSVQGYAYFK